MAEGYVTTHVLDAGRGCPAAGMRIELWRLEGEGRRKVREVVTNADGRTDAPVIPKGEVETGVWELVFHAGDVSRRGGGGRGEPAVPRRDPDPVRDRGCAGSTITCRCCWRGTATRRIGGVEAAEARPVLAWRRTAGSRRNWRTASTTIRSGTATAITALR